MKSAWLPLVTLIALPLAVSRADNPPAGMRPVPTRPPVGPSVALSDFEVLPDCMAEKVCAEGMVKNVGTKTAYAVRVRVEIGATKYGRPRTSFVQDLEDTEMDPGDSQPFNLAISRNYVYKEGGKDKVIQVGRFNFRVIPMWNDVPRPVRSATRKLAH